MSAAGVADRSGAAVPPTRPVRIGVIGAECTGKTALCEALALRLPAVWAPEVLREFCARAGRPPRVDEQAAIVAAQLAREDECERIARAGGLRFVLSDSTPLVTAAYSRYYFRDERLMAAAAAHQRRYALTLLTGTDLPWWPDGVQRDGPDVRDAFHHTLVAVLAEHGLAATAVHGQGDERFDAAARAVLTLRADPA